MSLRNQAGIVLPGYNPLKVANAPTIGTATAGVNLCASVTFTAPSCVGGGAISSYTVFANCGTKTASGASSPLVVTGLTTATSYTFKVIATNAYGPSYPSSASNSVTALSGGEQSYTTDGTYSWVAPACVTSVSIVAVGAGWMQGGTVAGGGGALGYKNNITVTPGSSYTLRVAKRASGQTTYITIGANTYSAASATNATGASARVNMDGGGDGGNGGSSSCGGGGGGAGGYTGNGGQGRGYGGSPAFTAGAGGGGGGGGAASGCCRQGGGGGVGLYGQGSNGATGGGGGSGGSSAAYASGPSMGGNYGGGGGTGNGAGDCGYANKGSGALRIVWPGTVRQFPSTNVGA